MKKCHEDIRKEKREREYRYERLETQREKKYRNIDNAFKWEVDVKRKKE